MNEGLNLMAVQIEEPIQLDQSDISGLRVEIARKYRKFAHRRGIPTGWEDLRFGKQTIRPEDE